MQARDDVRESRTLQRLFEITQDILQARELDPALLSIAHGIGDVFGFKYVSIVAGENPGDEWHRRVLIGFPEDVVRSRIGEHIPTADIPQLLLPEFEVFPNCYYVPAECDNIRWAHSIHPGERTTDIVREHPRLWHENDSLTLALTDRESNILGYVSVDGPADGLVPSRERLREMQLFVNLVALALGNARAHAIEIERRRLLEDTSRAQNEFFSIVSHEVRSPLAAIRGASGLLEAHFETLKPERRMELLGVLTSSAARLGTIFEDFLLLSRMDAGRLSLRIESVDPVAVVEESVARMESEHPDHEVRIAYLAPIPRVCADEGRVVQVLTNLLSNAAKYSAGHSIVVVEIKATEHAVWFGVKNEGPGIPEQERHKLFTRFARLAGSDDSSIGLGLFISAQLVQAMGGQIGCDSEPQRLTTFWFTLPSA